MAVRLTVDRQAWSAHVGSTVAATPGLVPVVKGNGYGFGRTTLMPHAARFSTEIAVGTVFEAADVPSDRTAVVLTPTLDVPADLAPSATLTVGSPAQVDVLRAANRRGQVIVKLASSMHRYGVPPTGLSDLLARCHRAQLEVVAFGLHLPLAGDEASRLREAQAWLHLLPDRPLWVSHLQPASVAALGADVRLRVGTALWHGDKSTLHLGADVLDVHAVRAGSVAGYRATTVPDDGWLVLAGAGSAHGVAPIDDGRSPFHFARRRLALLEPPHMHTTMLFVPASDGPPPVVGDVLDLQRPLITTTVDEVVWA
jgi:alanine racemase